MIWTYDNKVVADQDNDDGGNFDNNNNNDNNNNINNSSDSNSEENDVNDENDYVTFGNYICKIMFKCSWNKFIEIILSFIVHSVI